MAAAIFEKWIGSRYGPTSTLMPSRIRSVAPARKASAVIASRNGFSGGTMKLSDQLYA